jgi:hypothetical protein
MQKKTGNYEFIHPIIFNTSVNSCGSNRTGLHNLSILGKAWCGPYGRRQRDYGRGGHIRSAQRHGTAKPGALRYDCAGWGMDGICGSEEWVIMLIKYKD